MINDLIAAKSSVASALFSAGGTALFALADVVTVSIIVNVAAVAMSCIAAWVAWKTHKAVNSRMDEFKQIAEALFRAKGIEEGIAKEKADQKARQTK